MAAEPSTASISMSTSSKAAERTVLLPSSGVPPLTTYALAVAVASSLAGLSFGYEIGVIDSIMSMQSFGVAFGYAVPGSGATVLTPARDEIVGDITATFLAGAALGSLVASVSADLLGRKRSLLLGGGFFILGAATQTAAASLAMLLAGRALAGCGIGILSMVAPLYIAEVAPDHLRGRLVAVQQLLITAGVLLASISNAVFYKWGKVLGDGQWRGALACQLLPATALLAVVLPLPFSPRWLGAQGRWREASAVLARLRGVPEASPYVVAELASIRTACVVEDGVLVTPDEGGAGGGQRSDGEDGGGQRGKEEAERRAALPMRAQCGALRAKWHALFRAELASRVALVVILQVLQQLSGINVVLYYASDLFLRAGAPAEQAATTLVICNSAVLCIATVPGLWLVDKPGIGRRTLLVWGAGCMAVAHAAVCAFILASDSQPDGSLTSDAFAYVAVAFLMLFTGCFAATWGPVVWVVQSEVLPLHVRAQGTALGTLTNWVTNAGIGKAAPLIIRAIGAYTFLIFGAIMAAACVYAFVALPETAGVPLEDMERLFVPADGVSSAARQSCGCRVRPPAADQHELTLLKSAALSGAWNTEPIAPPQ